MDNIKAQAFISACEAAIKLIARQHGLPDVRLTAKSLGGYGTDVSFKVTCSTESKSVRLYTALIADGLNPNELAGKLIKHGSDLLVVTDYIPSRPKMPYLLNRCNEYGELLNGERNKLKCSIGFIRNMVRSNHANGSGLVDRLQIDADLIEMRKVVHERMSKPVEINLGDIDFNF